MLKKIRYIGGPLMFLGVTPQFTSASRGDDRMQPGTSQGFAHVALNSVVSPMGSRLSSITLMVVLAVIFVPAGHFLLLCLLLLLGDLVNPRRFRMLLLLIDVLVLLCHAILLLKVIWDSAKKNGWCDTLSSGSNIWFIDRRLRILLLFNSALPG